MGVPKFFRWVSERYPACSQLVEKNRIPEFDNLYLDMNGIIHQCSHDNDAEIDLKLPEEVVYEKICLYIDKLFALIEPQKVFFMAIDGVAPRAKMNQQRARRFRSAQENLRKREEMEEKINRSIDDEELFDSNCITPGTVFMENLSIYLHDFIQEKIVSDPLWQRVKIILSGHDVPGEGEHKIMDYIRALKSSDDHDPNTRHCLYGLDADLIMLSLVTHEPHFALLREEVKFSSHNDKKKPDESIILRQKWVGSLDQQRYYLMHTSLLREYLDMEFSNLKNELGDTYSSESFINDFILLCFFIGNDFLPHLPHLHIHDSALTELLIIYKEVLKTTHHYINVQGHLHLPTLLLLFEKMIKLEKAALNVYLENEEDRLDYTSEDMLVDINDEVDEEEDADEEDVAVGNTVFQEHSENTEGAGAFFQGERSDLDAQENPSKTRIQEGFEDLGMSNLSISSSRNKYDLGKDQVNNFTHPTPSKASFSLKKEKKRKPQIFNLPKSISPYQRSIIENLFTFFASTTQLEQQLNCKDRFFLMNLCAQLQLSISEPTLGYFTLRKSTAPQRNDAPDKRGVMKDDFDNDIVPDGGDGLDLLYNYMTLPISESGGGFLQPLNKQPSLEDAWAHWKIEYFTKKLEFPKDDLKPRIHQLACEYIRGLQWTLFYYYEGLASWGWFFPYHYTPFISDLAELTPEDIHLAFDMGEPFSPFEQLFAVLPAPSGQFLPHPLRELMFDPEFEPFFPSDFETDLNGKKHDWEKVIKLPFIDQHVFVKAIQSRLHLLSAEELHRNQLGVAKLYEWSASSQLTSPKQGPSTHAYRCNVSAYEIHKPVVLVKGVCKGVKPQAGFPSLRYLKTHYYHAFHGVNIFGRKSRNESIVLNVHPKTNDSVSSVCNVIGKTVYFQWPYLLFGLVVAVGCQNVFYSGKGRSRVMLPDEVEEFVYRKKIIDRIYHHERGIVLPPMNIMLYVRKFIQLKKMEDLSVACEFAEKAQWVSWDLVLLNVPFSDRRVQEHPPLPLELEYPINTEVFLLNPNLCYGAAGKIARLDRKRKEIDGHFLFFHDPRTLRFGHQFVTQKYITLSDLAYDLDLPTKVVSKLCSSVRVVMSQEETWNLGLNVKFSNQRLMVPGYTRFKNDRWEFSQVCYDMIYDFTKTFPVFIRKLEKETKHGLYTPYDFYSDMGKARIQLSKIKDWLAELPLLPAVPFDHELMTREEIQNLERALARLPSDALSYTKNAMYTYLTHVPLSLVLKPDLAPFVLKNQKISLGDRVLTISAPGRSCVGTYGYVVGLLSDNRVQVRQDTSFRGGTDLGERCSPHHGITLEMHQVLNLTQPITQPASPVHSSSASTSYHAPKPRSPYAPPPAQQHRSTHPQSNAPRNPSSGSYPRPGHDPSNGLSHPFVSHSPAKSAMSAYSAGKMTLDLKHMLNIDSSDKVNPSLDSLSRPPSRLSEEKNKNSQPSSSTRQANRFQHYEQAPHFYNRNAKR